MKVLKWILISLCAILAGIIAFFWYMGMFSKPLLYEKNMGPYTFAYEDFTGPYMETGIVFERVYKNLEKDGIKTTKGLGIYYDDPRNVPSDKLRSRCGNIIEKEGLEKLENVKNKYNITTISRTPGIVIEFPIKNSLSYMLGPVKNYTILTKYAEMKGYELNTLTYEIYDMEEKKIYFVMQINEPEPVNE